MKQVERDIVTLYKDTWNTYQTIFFIHIINMATHHFCLFELSNKSIVIV